MAIVEEAISYYENAAGEPFTISHSLTNGSSGADRFLRLTFSIDDRVTANIDSVTYNGVAGTLIRSSDAGGAGMRSVHDYYWLDTDLPSDTSAHDFVVDLSASNDEINMIVRELSGVDQTTITAGQISFLSNSDPFNVAYTPTNDGAPIYIDFYEVNGRAISSEPTTLDLDASPTTAGVDEARSYSRTGPTPAAEETYDWDFNANTNAFALVLELEAAAGGGGGGSSALPLVNAMMLS